MRFPLLFLVLVGTSLAMQPICDPNCAPSPSSDTYTTNGIILGRSTLVHARGMGGLAPSLDVGGTTQLLGSQSFSYAMPILSLPGRNGLDLNLTLYYNSQNWTLNGGSLTFNADRDFPSYGFRLDFGYLEKDATNNAFVLTEADGSKHRLNSTGTNSYDSADSSFIHLDTSTSTAPLIYYRGGRRMKYEDFNGSSTVLFRPIELTDTNGNYISISYVSGKNQQINTITDTLGRVVTFNYLSDRLTSITHDGRTWSFTWNNSHVLYYNFTSTSPDSPASGTILPVLAQVAYPNGTGFSFGYGSWGMVSSISRLASNNTLSITSYDYPGTGTALSDAPTYTQQTVTSGGVAAKVVCDEGKRSQTMPLPILKLRLDCRGG